MTNHWTEIEMRFECTFCQHLFDDVWWKMTHPGFNTSSAVAIDAGGIMASPPDYEEACPECDKLLEPDDYKVECCDCCGQPLKLCECEDDNGK